MLVAALRLFVGIVAVNRWLYFLHNLVVCSLYPRSSRSTMG
jgi:hypothetical protein